MIKLPKLSASLKERFENITYRQWVIMAMAVSLIMGALVYLTLSDKSVEEKNTAKVDMVKVVVAKEDIAERTVIKEEMLKIIELPKDAVPPLALSDIDEAKDLITSTAVYQGDIMTEKKVFKDIRLAGFTGTIPANCRAVSLAITDITGLSGFAKAGDYVDIMLVSGKKETGLHGEVLMQNVLLLGINKNGAAGTNANAAENTAKDKAKDVKDSDGSIKGSSDAMATATLALPLDEALKVAVAAQKGTIYLALRPYKPADLFTLSTEINMRGEKAEESTKAPSVPAPMPSEKPTVANPAPSAPINNSPPPSRSDFSTGIEVIRGTERSNAGVN